jgi:cell wall-associated NlpC family hydrolase
MTIQMGRRDAGASKTELLMRRTPKRAIALLVFCAFASGVSSAQSTPESARPRQVNSKNSAHSSRPAGHPRTLSPDDGLAVIAAALDTRVRPDHEPDCSHLVHAIYSRAGFPYSYAPSSDLYAGTREFQRVNHPQPGDLVVWEGHAGIVVNPASHVFFSALRSGLGTDAYDAPYWKSRGHLRFYRYIKGSSAIARK